MSPQAQHLVRNSSDHDLDPLASLTMGVNLDTGAKVVSVDDLTRAEQTALGAVVKTCDNAHGIFTGRNVAAGLVVGKKIQTGINLDSSNRGKFCAEKAALGSAIERGFFSETNVGSTFKTIDSIVVVSKKINPKGENSIVPPICLCAECRDLLAPFCRADTSVVMASADTKLILRTQMDSVHPLFLSGPDLIYDQVPRPGLLLKSLQLFNFEQISRDHAEILRACARQINMASRSSQLTVTVLSENNRQYSSTKRDSFPRGVLNIEPDQLAILKAVEKGDENITTMFVVGSHRPPCGVTRPSAQACQMLYDLGDIHRRTGIQIVMASADLRRVATVELDDLFPMADGPRQSKNARPFSLYKARKPGDKGRMYKS